MTRLMGILNVTPDSFSDGGRDVPESAIFGLKQLIQDGAELIDIGAESTRPGAEAIGPQEEWQRLEPVLAAAQNMPERSRLTISIDTHHAETAAKVLTAGADWINDVCGAADPAMQRVLAGSDCRVVIMHSLTVPAEKGVTLPEDCDPVQEVCDWAQQRVSELEKAGIRKERLLLDPGLGFGKTAQQSIALLRGIGRLRAVGLPLLIGHSRKSFLQRYTDAPAAQRDAETLWISCTLAAKGVEVLRVHDVAGHARALRMLSDIFNGK